MGSIRLTGFEGRLIEVQTGLFINGEFVPASHNATLEVENPTTKQTLATISACQKEDVDIAVQAAKNAYSSWRTVAPCKRAALLDKLADLVERNAPDLASLQALESGQLYRESLGLHVTQAVETLRYYAGWADKIDGETLHLTQGLAYTRREPIGVCAAIVPWNTLMIAFWKLAPAIAAGNVLVLKTPEITPLWGQKLAELVKESGFPPGVINIVCGYGAVAGQALSEHMDVRKLAFTGSPGVGRQILTSAARSNLKRVSLELGGKSPSIVFDDADWENALLWTTLGITASNGQICAAGSRIYVQATIYDRFLQDFTRRIREAVPGDPFSPETTKGAVASKSQLDKIVEYVEKGKNSGARLLHGGQQLAAGGYLIENTAFADVPQDADIMREEVFGPLASIASFTTEEEVIAKANDSAYGLSAAVFTNDVNRAFRVSEALESGQVTINSWGDVSPNAPFGGTKESGFGRDMGKEALADWTTSPNGEAMNVAWERLIRFISTDGLVLWGEPMLPNADFDLGTTTADTRLRAKVVRGTDIYDTTGATKVTEEVVTVHKLLGPLEPHDVPMVRCVGLNYRAHILEAGRKVPPFPSIFFKPPTTVIGHGENVVIPKIAQDDQADYEGELCVIIGREAKDVSEETALDYVAGYTVGNDISSRKLQRNPELAGSVPQWGFSKGFDTFAPLGPALVSSRLIVDPATLHLQTKINGELRQDAGIDDLVFDVRYLIARLSTGTTLQKGSVIMTGTPGGVGAGLKPPEFLKPGTVMEVSIPGIGTLRNGVEFA